VDEYKHPRVVVGVDGSLTGLAALRFAVAEAGRRQVPLFAVRAATTGLPCADRAAIATAFWEALGTVPADLEIYQEVAMLGIRDALRASATDARDLVVVGAGGKGGWHALWSGSVARSLLRGARCPVVAVPGPEMARAVHWPRRRRLGRGDVWERIEQEAPGLRGRSPHPSS
jgi:nucleotide-binding universal stress UspA family protein